MDRRTIYAGQLPLEIDLLSFGQDAMVGLAEFCSTVLGAPTLVDAFTCTPTIPASLSVVLTPGNIYQIENLEQTAWSSMPANIANSVMKQGILLDAATLAVTPPTTFGYSQIYLLEVSYADDDTGALVLPYRDAADTDQPFNGPGNAGAAQDTIRHGQVVYQLKAGTPAPTGTALTPNADPGWAGLFAITVANGQPTITAGNIQQLATAPFLATLGHLPQIPNGVQNWQWSYCTDLGSTNKWIGTIAPLPLGLTPGLSVRIKVANTVTGDTTFNLNGFGAFDVHRSNGAQLSSGDVNAGMVADLIFDGSAWQLSNFDGFTSTTVNNNTSTLTIPYVADTGTVNNVVAPFSPAISTVSAGNPIEVKIAHTNTGASTITINSLAAAPIVDLFGNPLQPGMIVTGEVALMLYTGTAWQLVNRSSAGALINIQVITASGNYIPSPGATKALVFATGGGASGSCACGGGPGGGAGATAVGLVSLVGISSVSCTIGSGGSSVTGHGLLGNNGNQTLFGSFLTAGGGLAANFTAGGFPANFGGGLGGTAIGGLINIAGGDARVGSAFSNNSQSGNGGDSFWGGGGAGYFDTFTGQPGRAYGAGGGGADDVVGGLTSESVTSGAGAQGVIFVLEF